MFKVLRYFAFPVSLDHECQNITEIAVSNLLSVFAFRFETLNFFSAGISKAKTTSTRLELIQLQTFTDPPQKLHRNGQSIKAPVTLIFFGINIYFVICSNQFRFKKNFKKLKTQSYRALKGYYVVLKVTCGLVTNRQVMTYNTVKTFSSPTNLSHLL